MRRDGCSALCDAVSLFVVGTYPPAPPPQQQQNSASQTPNPAFPVPSVVVPVKKKSPGRPSADPVSPRWFFHRGNFKAFQTSCLGDIADDRNLDKSPSLIQVPANPVAEITRPDAFFRRGSARVVRSHHRIHRPCRCRVLAIPRLRRRRAVGTDWPQGTEHARPRVTVAWLARFGALMKFAHRPAPTRTESMTPPSPPPQSSAAPALIPHPHPCLPSSGGQDQGQGQALATLAAVFLGRR
ncbi:hypothetical protein QBC39DRAFT_90113 [Podospora conica]|nr:hypothetical protein QBC39DRAFT_90113 [Schizothecium conicum]